MNLTAMKLFCEVARYRSFSEGATANGITQSAASQAVSQLEREVGVKLIDRGKRPLVLTGEGEVYYTGFCDILHRYEAIEADIRSLREEMSGTVRVAAIYSVGLYEMHDCMQGFMMRCPKARVRLHYLLPHRVYEAVLKEDVDLGVVSYPTPSRELSVIPLYAERMVLACHPQHHLATQSKISIRQLQGENFIAFERDLTICKELDRRLRERQVTVRKVMEFDNVETIKQAIQIGAGISILPEPTIRREAATRTIASVPIEDEVLERPIGVIHRQRKTFTPVMRKFVDVLQNSRNQGAT